MAKEKLTRDELGMLAISLNVKIRELENAVDRLSEEGDTKLLEEFKRKLADTQILQEKLFRMYKFG